MAEVRITGLAELLRDLRAIDAELPKEVRRTLKAGAEIVAVEARGRSAVRSGMQRRSIRAFARGRVAGVRATAKRRSARYPSGYNYPARNEFQSGRRAFLRPALEAKAGEVERRVGRMLDDLADRYWEG